MHIKSDAAMRCRLIKINCNMKLQAERHTHTRTHTYRQLQSNKGCEAGETMAKRSPKQSKHHTFKWPSYMSIPTAPPLSSYSIHHLLPPFPRCLQHTNSLAINRTDFYGCCCCDSPDTRSISLCFVGNGNPCVGVSQH